jgi:LPS-assembly protein
MVFKKVILLAVLFMPPEIISAASIDYKEINAEKIIYNTKTGDIKTTGKTSVVSTAGQKMTLNDAYFAKKNANGNNLILEWNNNTFMTAETLLKEDKLTYADNVTYTACHNCDPLGDAWTVHATNMIHDNETRDMYFYNFWFDIYGIPIFYWPYLTQPDPTVKYRSGLLIPELGSSTNMGTRISIPVYFNFSDNHDMTITTAYLTDENPLFIAEHRLQLEHSKFYTTGSFTNTKDGLNRWHIFHDNKIDMGENMRLVSSIQSTSDKTYLQTYDFYNAQPFLESNVRLEMFREQGYTTIDTNIFQELRQEVDTNSNDVIPKGNILPKIRGTYQFAITDDLYAQMTGDFMRIQDFNNNSSANRLIGEVRVIAPIELAWQKITISGAVRNDNYSYQNMDTAPENSASRTLSSGYFDWEMPFVRNGESWTQIIKPKARVTFMGKSSTNSFINMDSTGALLSDASLFVNNRYSGYDMWVNGTYSDYGVSWAGYNATGQSYDLFIGQTYDFNTNDQPDINSGYHDGASDVVGRIAVSPIEWMNLTNRLRFDKDNLYLRHLESDVRLGNRNYVSFGYIWAVQFSEMNDVYIRNDDVSEGTFGAGLYFSDRLSLRGNDIYNFTSKVHQRYNVGLYYEHPCYTFGLVYNVDNAVSDIDNENLEYSGVKSLKFKFSIKMGK